jgi:hypothetical protein
VPSIAPDDPASLNSTGADVPMCAFAISRIYTSLTGTTEMDGFAFVNSWTFDATETAILTNLVTEAVDVIEIVLSPLIAAAEGPLLAVEAGVPFIGPWLVVKRLRPKTTRS